LASTWVGLDFRGSELGLVLASTSGIFLLATTRAWQNGGITDFWNHAVFLGLRHQGLTATTFSHVEATASISSLNWNTAGTWAIRVLATARLNLDFRSQEFGLVASTSLVFLRATTSVNGAVNQSRFHDFAIG